MLEAEAVTMTVGQPIILRLGGIYGSARSRLIERVRAGAECVAEPPQYTNRIHRCDAATAIAHLLMHSTPASTYLGVDSDPAPRHVVLDWLADRLQAPPVVRLALASRAASGAGPGSKRCNNARLLDSGLSLRYPSFRDGYRSMLADLGKP